MANLDLFRPSQEMNELSLLQEIEKNPTISQRELSNKFGIALGVTNACLKRMARRGWIRMMGLNRRKIGYYLTPKGFTERARLTVHLISWTVHHYSALKEIIGNKFLEMQRDGIERIVFYGISDEMEIAYVSLQGVKMKLIGIVEDEDKMTQNDLFGFKMMDVHQTLALAPDAVLITVVTQQEEKMERLKELFVNPPFKIYRI